MNRLTMLGMLTHPLPSDLLGDIRTFLRRVNENVFDGNVSEMARTIECDRTQLSRSLKGEGQSKIHADVVQACWTYMLLEFGMRSLYYLPSRLRVIGLAVQFFDLEQSDDGYVSQATHVGEYAIDAIELARDVLGSSERFVVPMRGDTMMPELPPGTHLVAVKMEGTSRPTVDGIYIFRLEDSIQIRRLQRMPGYRVRVLSSNDQYDPYVIDLNDADFEVLGRIWGHYVRTS